MSYTAHNIICTNTHKCCVRHLFPLLSISLYNLGANWTIPVLKIKCNEIKILVPNPSHLLATRTNKWKLTKRTYGCVDFAFLTKDYNCPSARVSRNTINSLNIKKSRVNDTKSDRKIKSWRMNCRKNWTLSVKMNKGKVICFLYLHQAIYWK